MREWATQAEIGYLDALEAHGSIAATAKALGVNERTITRSMQRLKRRAAIHGHSPEHDMTKTVPDGFVVKGVSTYYDQEGKPRGQWVKSSADDAARLEILKETIGALSESVRGMSPIVDKPRHTNKELLTVYPLGDPHFGLRVWARDCGANFDLKEARRVTMGAVDRLVQTAPASDTAIILPLGDVFHADDQRNVTPGHGHQLDVDSRYVHVLQIGIETFRHVVLRALEKHKRVIVRFVQGNHDPHAVWALSFTIAAYFANDKRVEVDLSPAKAWFYRFGSALIGSTHGDTTKPEQLSGVMACDRAKDWGETAHRYWYCGHVHHSSLKEYPGCTVETFRTLAAADAYAMGHGYRAGRDMRAIVIHRDHGEIERHRCDIGMV
jgi:UDP-2,3-diacylglucosamine pyrophosphatase LpxH